MKFTQLTGKEAEKMVAEIRRLNMSRKKHFFNVLMWIILMVIPMIILQLTDFFKAVVWKLYWPYKDWVERIFPTRRP